MHLCFFSLLPPLTCFSGFDENGILKIRPRPVVEAGAHVPVHQEAAPAVPQEAMPADARMRQSMDMDMDMD